MVTIVAQKPVDAPEHYLEPLPYHVALMDYLKSHERELWNWFASARAQADYTENLRLELLKSTYRLGPDDHPSLHRSLAEAKSSLQLDIPVTLYQAQNSPQLNAALYFIPGEGHIVFTGPILTHLDENELKSVLGHELTHYHLWQLDNGDFHIADRLLQAVVQDPRASGCHEQSARRFQLYTEIFADRGSLRATGEVPPVVTSLVKIQTGLTQVSAANYLKQAGEIFANGPVATEGISHPESFIRARAVALWQEQGAGADSQITGMIEGTAALEDLDVIGQTRLTGTTRQFLEYFLQPKWFQTPAVIGHARLFFPNFQPAATPAASTLENFKFSDPKLREYLCFLLLDFVTADPDLDDLPLMAALHLSRQLEMEAQFEKLAARELKLKIRDVRKLQEQAAGMLARAEVPG